jgi:hypothetical protein
MRVSIRNCFAVLVRSIKSVTDMLLSLLVVFVLVVCVGRASSSQRKQTTSLTDCSTPVTHCMGCSQGAGCTNLREVRLRDISHAWGEALS